MSLKIVCMDTEAGIPLIHQPVSSLPNNSWPAVRTSTLSWPCNLHLTWMYNPSVLSWDDQTWESHMETCFGLDEEMSQHLSGHVMQHVLDIAGHRGKSIVMQHNDTLYKHTKCFCSNSVHWWWYQGPWTAALAVHRLQRKNLTSTCGEGRCS
jgi:hypothetical protein